MAKGLRSKVKRRFRTLRRKVVEDLYGRSEAEGLSSKLVATIENRNYRVKEPKNAFLYPNDPDAAFPQKVVAPIVDLRAAQIPIAGAEFIGALRKKKQKEEVHEDNEDIFEEVGEEEVNNVEEDAEDLVGDLEKLGIEHKPRRQRKKKGNIEIEPMSVKSKPIKKKDFRSESCRRSKKFIRF
eukprot:TRINITY_DN4412_c0_g1_i7.p1 TRINITY_DN4412_c0_g1~~TRINITY_DN4412_c0_g1_i7.p1  ORF type:complete len:182 (-),score=59.97 TRINITY_DN4412_c0_g1_i7:39-584(-)